MTNKWEWAAGKLFLRNKSWQVCRHRIAQLAEQMNFEEVPYTLFIGQRKTWLGKISKHTWIEMSDKTGTIKLDPTGTKGAFTVTNKYRMNQGIGGEHWVGMMFINKWLKEIR